MGKVVELSIIFCMENHFYMLGGEIRRQSKGAGIGLRCSEALGRAFGLDWDRRLIQRLEELNWPPLMIKRYVDDLNAILTALGPGVRYNQVEGKLEVVQELVEDDMRREKDDLTMAVFGEIANAIDPNIEVEIDFPSKHPSKMLAILDMEMCMIKNKVHYMFYRQELTGRVFKLRVGSGSGIGKIYRVGFGFRWRRSEEEGERVWKVGRRELKSERLETSLANYNCFCQYSNDSTDSHAQYS